MMSTNINNNNNNNNNNNRIIIDLKIYTWYEFKTNTRDKRFHQITLGTWSRNFVHLTNPKHLFDDIIKTGKQRHKSVLIFKGIIE